jgi:hypothetical protein
MAAALGGDGFLRVRYDEVAVLKIHRDATNLGAPRSGLRFKLTADAVSDLIALAEGWEVLCRSSHATSGRISRPHSAPKSSRTSRPSSRR